MCAPKLASVLLVGLLTLVAASGRTRAQPAPQGFEGVASPLRLVPLAREPLRVRGLHSYLGSIGLAAASDGLTVVDELPLERYLLGLNEVPPTWPAAALRAQAIAARTYTLWTLAEPRAGAAAIYGFDICASDQCQVYSGADVIGAAQGSRWANAVRSTRGEAILYQGEPILARYHSTSGGATLANSQGFAGSTDLPYLRSVPSPLEGGSPFFRWRTQFRLVDLEAMLEAAGWWSDSLGPLRDVRSTRSRLGLHYPDVVFSFEDERLVRSAEELRAVLRDLAPRLRPRRYPSYAPDGTTRLPETLPSNRVRIDTREGMAVVWGRGWGHGVGMSQWGAHGMARAGAGYREILSHYYRGTTIGAAPSPGPIEVGVAWARRSIVAFGAFRLVDGRGRTVVARALGSWRFEWSAPGVVDVTAPPGHARALEMEVVRAPERVRAGRAARLTVDLTAPARLSVAAASERSAAVTRDAGRRRIEWRAPRRSGTYRIRVRAAGASGAVASGELRVEVVEPTAGRARVGPGPWRTALLGIAAVVLLLLLAVGTASFAGTIRK